VCSEAPRLYLERKVAVESFKMKFDDASAAKQRKMATSVTEAENTDMAVYKCGKEKQNDLHGYTQPEVCTFCSCFWKFG